MFDWDEAVVEVSNEANWAQWDKLDKYLDWDQLYNVEYYGECSGFCRQSLFYFTTDITKGLPGDKCVWVAYSHMERLAAILANLSLIIGSLHIVCFMFAACLIGKTETQSQIEHIETDKLTEKIESREVELAKTEV